MPPYYLDIPDGIHVIDAVGRELPDHQVARREALKIAAGAAGTAKARVENGCVVARDAPDSGVMTIGLACNVEAPHESGRRQA